MLRPVADNPKTENARRALAVMTAWLANPDGTANGLVEQTMLDAIHQEEDEIDRLLQLANGLVSVCGLVLGEIVKETGISEAETLRRVALRITE